MFVRAECFAPATKCHNCCRKGSSFLTQKAPSPTLKRCTGCFLMSYCDIDCQREHWEKVHKGHCLYLSGKKILAHSQNYCSMCADGEKGAGCAVHRWLKLIQPNSPKTSCAMNEMIKGMEVMLSAKFGFHAEGKVCSCSLTSACKIAFILGEVSGHYVGVGGDALLGHAMKLVHAMRIKSSKDEVEKVEKLEKLAVELMANRALRLGDLLIEGNESESDYCNGMEIYGKERKEIDNTTGFIAKVKELEIYFGSRNAWWKALYFTLEMNERLKSFVVGNRMEMDGLEEDTRFINLKKIHDFQQKQLKKAAKINENNLWHNYMLWPKLNGRLMEIILPEGSRCHGCDGTLGGPATITASEGDPSLPRLEPRIGDNEKFVTFCSPDYKPMCVRTYDPMLHVDLLEHQKEERIFMAKSRKCMQCLKYSLSSHRCSACLAAQYCSTLCQDKDLAFHRTVCSKWAGDKSRKIIGGKKQEGKQAEILVQYS